MVMKTLPPDFLSIYYSPYDWTEDFDKENGKFQQTCDYCKKVFLGHKRRVVCKECVKKLKKDI